MNDPTTKPFVHLDADHAGSILVLLSEYHTYVLEAWHCGEAFTNDEVADTCYMIGNIEGRCLYGGLTQDDLDLINAWKEELEEWKSWHGGRILINDDEPDCDVEEIIQIDAELDQFCREHDPNWDED